MRNIVAFVLMFYCSFLLASSLALAADPVATPAAAASAIPASPGSVTLPMIQPAQELPAQDFLSQVLQAIQGFGGLSTMMKISTAILLIVASMKVAFMKNLVWSKLGEGQAWVPLALGLIAGVLGIGSGGAKITLASVLAYVASGGGAIILHELLDSVKAMPGLGAIYVSVINVIESVLPGGSKPQDPPSQKAA